MREPTESGSSADEATPSTQPRLPVPGAGDSVGRFQIEELIGAGGMGRVYRAHDPELDRTVAVKLLPGEGWSVGSQRTRFLREARAMAKLRHPNVVTIHDSGEHDGRPYIAMELLEGQTLARWLRAERRPWRAIRDAFLAAGRGLAAAHDAGLVHRDFKPANVIIGPGGVRVVDFGLALSAADDGDSGEGSPSLDGIDLTRTGALVGTLGYLAPERLTGRRATPRSDQWSFCVALHEALYRRRPYLGDSAQELADAMGEPLVLDPGPPRFLVRLLKRGLAFDPAARYPSMAALLRDLDRDPGRTARRVTLATGALAVVGVTLALSWPSLPAPCRGARAHLAGVWDDPARQSLHAAFAATGKPFAEDIWKRTRARLDAYADQWTQAHTASCEAGRVRDEQSPELLDRRMQCLDRLARDMRTFVATVSSGLDAEALQKVVAASGNLGAVADCADTASLLARPPRPADPALRRRIDELDAMLTAELTRGQLHNPVVACKAIDHLRPELEAFPWAPLRARGLVIHGRLLNLAGRLEEAERAFEAAIRAAEDAGDGRQVAEAWIRLLVALGDDHQHAQALTLSLAAEMALRRAGSPPDLMREHEVALALLEFRGGKLAEARARLQRILPSLGDPGDALMRIRVYTLLGQIAAEAQDAPAILDSSRKVIAEAAAAVGADSQTAGHAHQGLGAALMAQGDNAGAIHELTEARRIFVLVMGEDSNEAANTATILSMAYLAAGDRPGARAASDEGLAALRRIGKPSDYLGIALEQRGFIAQTEGRFADARAAFQEALDVRRAFFGEDHATTALSIASLAAALIDEGRPAEAVPLLEQTLAAFAKLSVTGTRRGRVLVLYGHALRHTGRPLDAIAAIERARPDLAAAEATFSAEADLELAEALRDARQRERARASIAAARARCAGGQVEATLCKRIEDLAKKIGVPARKP